MSAYLAFDFIVSGRRIAPGVESVVVRPVAARRIRPTITNAAAQVVVSAASVVLSPSIVGLINSATPGIVKTLSNSGLIVGIN